jgi:hypothetical protein
MTMFKRILAYFESQGWKYSLPKEIEDESHIAFIGIITNNGKFHCIIDVNEIDKKIIFFSIYPKNVPDELRNQIAEILLRLNYILFLGSFEMDFSDGEIRLKTSFIYDEYDISEQMLNHIIKGNIATMDNNFEFIGSFMNQKISMDDAIQFINQVQENI